MSSKIEIWGHSRMLCQKRAIPAGGRTKFLRDLSFLVGGQIAGMASLPSLISREGLILKHMALSSSLSASPGFSRRWSISGSARSA